MKRTIMTKSLSLLLALVFVFSSVMSAALFIVSGDYEPGETRTSAEQITKQGQKETIEEDILSISKTIKGTNVENEFIITLEVETTEDIKGTFSPVHSAVVVVFDTSGSMDENYSGSEKRMVRAKKALIEFITSYKNSSNGGERWFALVTFSTSAEKKIDWVNLADVDLDSGITATINGLISNGGTNIAAGLKLAADLMKNETVSHIETDKRFAILETDGNPTYGINKEGTRFGSGSATTAKEVASAEYYANLLKAEVSKLFTIAIAVSSNICFKYTGRTNCDKVVHSHAYNSTPASSCYSTTPSNCTNSNHTQAYNGSSGNKKHTLDCYPIDCFLEEHQHNNQTCGSKNVDYSITIGHWLANNIASSVDDAFNASDADELSLSLVDIASVISRLAKAWTLEDPMGANMQFMNFGYFDELGRFIASNNVQADFSTANNAFTWNILAHTPTMRTETIGDESEGNYQIINTYTYTLSYKVKLDTTASGFVQNTEYPTNGNTVLTYIIIDEDMDPEDIDEDDLVDYTIQNIPAVEGSTANFSFKKVGEANFDIPITGTEFTIFIGASVDTATWSQTVACGTDGIISFQNLPSGHTFKIKETKAAEGYALDDTVYSLTVAYGEVTSNIIVDIPNNLKRATYKVYHFFETGYGTGTYNHDTSYDQTELTIVYSQTKYAKDHKLSNVPNTYVYDDNKTENNNTNASITFDSVTKILHVYYKVEQNPTKTYNVVYLFQKDYGSAEYIEAEPTFLKSFEIKSDNPNTINANDTAIVGCMASERAISDYALFTYNSDLTAENNTSLTFENIINGVSTLYVYFDLPAKKNYEVRYYFQTPGTNASQTSNYEHVDHYDKKGLQITFDQTVSASTYAVFGEGGIVLRDREFGYTFYNELNTQSITYSSQELVLKVYLAAPTKTYVVNVVYNFQNSHGSDIYTPDANFSKTVTISFENSPLYASAYKDIDASKNDLFEQKYFGYTYNAIKTNGSVTYKQAAEASSTLTLNVYYDCPDSVSYLVYYYFENSEGSYILELTQSFAIAHNGTATVTDTLIQYPYNNSNYEYFTYDADNANRVNSLTYAQIANATSEDGKALKLYYNYPESLAYNVEFYFQNNTNVNQYDFGFKLESITIAYNGSANADSYKNTPFNENGYSSSLYTYVVTADSVTNLTYAQIAEGSTTLKLYYNLPNSISFKVEYYFADASGNYNKDTSLSFNEVIAQGGSALASSYVNKAYPKYDFYTYNANHKDAVNSLTYAEVIDGNDTLKLYFDYPQAVSYNIEYYFENASGIYVKSTVFGSTNLILSFGETVSVTQTDIDLPLGNNDYLYYVYEPDNTSAVNSLTYAGIKGGTNTLKLYYSYPQSTVVNIEYYFSNGSAYVQAPLTPSQVTINFGGTVFASTYQDVPFGSTYIETYRYYTFANSSVESVTYNDARVGNNTIKLYYNYPVDLQLTVRYFFQNPAGATTGYTHFEKYDRTITVKYNDTYLASNYKTPSVALDQIHTFYVYNANMTESGTNSRVSYAQAYEAKGNVYLDVYYDCPDSKQFKVVYLFQNPATGIYETDNNFNSSSFYIRFNETHNALEYSGLTLTGTSRNGYNYSDTDSKSGIRYSLTYTDIDAENDTIYVYFNCPEAKQFYVRFYFESAYKSKQYVYFNEYDLGPIEIIWNNTVLATSYIDTIQNFLPEHVGYTYNATATAGGTHSNLSFMTMTSGDYLIVYLDAPRPEDREFTVEHYTQNAVGSMYYTLKDSYEYTITIEFPAKYASDFEKNYSGYSYDPTNSLAVNSIHFNDETRVLKLYYTLDPIPAKQVKIVHLFEDKVSGEYVADITKTDTKYIDNGTTIYANRNVLASIPEGYHYDASLTVNSDHAYITYQDAKLDGSSEVWVYYTLDPVEQLPYIVKHLFQTSYGSQEYEQKGNDVNGFLGEETLYAKDFVLESIQEGYFYDSSLTENGPYSMISKAEYNDGILYVYYSLEKPQDKFFNVVYMVGTSPIKDATHTYTEYRKDNYSIEYGNSFAFDQFIITIQGYTFNSEQTMLVNCISTSYEMNNDIIIYYDMDMPAEKTFDVFYYFEQVYGQKDFILGDQLNDISIGYGEEYLYSDYLLNTIPEGYEFNLSQTNAGGFTKVSYNSEILKIELYYTLTEKPVELYLYNIVCHYTMYEDDVATVSFTKSFENILADKDEEIVVNTDDYTYDDNTDLTYEYVDGETTFVMDDDTKGKTLHLYYEIRFSSYEESSQPLVDPSSEEETSAEEESSISSTEDSSSTPKTGDDTSKLAFYFSLAIFSAMGLIVLTIRENKQKQKQ